MIRPDRDQLGLLLAHGWSLRGTCARRRVGCVLMDRDGHQLASGYNGPASGEPHCIATPCPGATLPAGEGLDQCQAIHAEANALLRCPDVRLIDVAYVTTSPCVHCVKLLMNTGCRRIVFAERYAHDSMARWLWERSVAPAEPYLRAYDPSQVQTRRRTWEQLVPNWFILDDAEQSRYLALRRGDT